MKFDGWLLLLYALPTGRNSLRVNLWRKLRKVGAVSLKTSASLLPDTPEHYELFQWIAKQIGDGGGEATLIRTKQIENLAEPQVIALFHAARTDDYTRIVRDLTALARPRRKPSDAALAAELERLRGRFAEVRKIDFFDCPQAHDVQMLFRKIEGRPRRSAPSAPILKRADYLGRTWLTRPQPQIDRVGSAWLIGNFIDPKARFVFAPSPAAYPRAVPYDMADVELTHQVDDCTFETLLKRFGLRDRALVQIAAMIHDADLGDGKFHAPGADGIDRILKGLAHLGWADEKILRHGFVCFDALYAHVKAT